MDGDSAALLSAHHGFSTTTIVDHRAWLWTVGFLSLIYSILALAARVTSKWGLLWYDDAILGAGYVFAWAHYGLLYRSVSEGLGAATSHLTGTETDSAAQYFFASRAALIVALCFAKVSVVAFTRRIFSGNMYGEKWLFGTGYALTAGWGVMALLVSSVGCHPLSSLVAQKDALCAANATRWKIITTFDVLTEVLLLILPAWLVSRNQIKASKKRVVAFVFSFRLIVAGFSIASMAEYFDFLDNGNGRDSIGLTNTIVWLEVTLCVSLISASIPSLRTFLWAFMSRGMFTMYGADTKHSAVGSQGGNIPMHSMGRSQNNMSQSRDEDLSHRQPRSGSRLRPDWLEYRVDVKGASKVKNHRRDGESGSIKSDGSEQMIIHRNVEFEVHED